MSVNWVTLHRAGTRPQAMCSLEKIPGHCGAGETQLPAFDISYLHVPFMTKGSCSRGLTYTPFAVLSQKLIFALMHKRG